MPRRSSYKTISQMTYRYVLVLLVLGLLAFADFFITSFQADLSASNAFIINISARQRSLAIHAAELSRGIIEEEQPERLTSLRKELLLTAKQMETIHEDLISGHMAPGITSAPSKEVQVLFYNPPTFLDTRINEFITQLRLLADDPYAKLTPDNVHYEYINTTIINDEMLNAMDRVVNQFQKEAEQRIARLKTLITINFTIMIIVLVLMGWFVFRPMIDTVRRHTDDLEKSNEALANELEFRHKVEEELKQSEMRIAAIVNTVIDGIVSIDERGVIRFFNPAAERMFLYTADEIMGRNIQIILPEVLDGGHSGESITATGELRQTHEMTGIRKDGAQFPVTLALDEVRLGDQVMYTGIIRDVTEQREYENNLRELTRRLRRSNRELQDFAVVASHDLQEPLRKIMAFNERLRKTSEDSLDEQSRNYLARMDNAAHRMQELIQDLLMYSRVTTKARPFEPVNLNEIVGYVLSDMEIRIEELHATVSVEDLPMVDADATQMRQLFQNLLSNALKFHRDNVPPVVKIYPQALTSMDAPGDGRRMGEFCKIVVEDNGIGFEKEYSEQIFNVFQRLHGRSKYEGTGVGLAICRKIVERHGGALKAESESGKGSRFYIILPFRQEEGHTPRHEEPEEQENYAATG